MLRNMKRLRVLAHQECLPPCPPFLLDSAELMETLPPADFLLPGWTSFPLSKWGLLGKDAPLVPSTDPDRGLFCTVNWNLVCGLTLLPILGEKDWDKATEWACARDQLLWPYRQASIGGITSLRLWRGLTWRVGMRLVQVARSVLVALSPSVLLSQEEKGAWALALLICQNPHHLHLQLFRW